MKQNLREGAKEQRGRKRLYIKIYNLYGTLLVNLEKTKQSIQWTPGDTFQLKLMKKWY